MLTTKQLEERKLGIGGSDLAAICGLIKNRTPFQVFLEKTGQLDAPPFDYEENPRADWGHRLEDPVAKKFEDKTGFKVYAHDDAFVHPDYPFMRANIDRLIEGEAGKDAFLECKSADKDQRDFWGENGSSKMPRKYLLQVAHYCMVLNKSKAYVAVLIGGNDFRILEYNRNADLEAKILSVESNFWNNHVIPKIPPSLIDINDMETSFKIHSTPNPIAASPETFSIVEQYNALREEVSKKQSDLDHLKFKILESMENHDMLTDAHGGVIATYKQHKVKRLDNKKVKDLLALEQYESCLSEKDVRTFRTKTIETE